MKRVAAAALAVALGCGQAPVSDETRRREAYLRQLAEREGLADAWHLMSRADLVFEDGFSLTDMVPPAPPPRWTELPSAIGSVRAVPVRWMTARAHLRVRGAGDMHLALWGHVDVARIFTRPRLTLSVAGHEVASGVIDASGDFAVATVVPAAWLDGWVDAYLRLSSVSEPWRDPALLQAARVEGVTWEPAP